MIILYQCKPNGEFSKKFGGYAEAGDYVRLEDYRNLKIAHDTLAHGYRKASERVCELEDEKQTVRNNTLRSVIADCKEISEHYAAYKDTALINGDVELSNAASGESRACDFLANHFQGLIK